MDNIKQKIVMFIKHIYAILILFIICVYITYINTTICILNTTIIVKKISSRVTYFGTNKFQNYLSIS